MTEHVDVSKCSKGEWIVDESNPQLVAVEVEGDEAYQYIANTDCTEWSATTRSDKEIYANASLIAEAGTVASETGLSPRQLAEQRAELLQGCLFAKRHIKNGSPKKALPILSRLLRIARVTGQDR
jgi:hypothetical protein